MLTMAMRAFAGYHTRPVLSDNGGEITLADPRLLLYYQNRLAAHALGFDPRAVRASVTRGSERPAAAMEISA
jgi:glycerol-3-phosphate O-acyltransferase